MTGVSQSQIDRDTRSKSDPNGSVDDQEIHDAEVVEEDPTDTGTDDDAGTCKAVNPFIGAFHNFKAFGRIVVTTRQVRENPEDLRKVKAALDRFTKALEKIENEYHDA